MKSRINLRDLALEARQCGLQIQHECAGYRLVRQYMTSGRSDVYPDGGVCRVAPARELSIFLAGVLWADKQHRGKLEN